MNLVHTVLTVVALIAGANWELVDAPVKPGRNLKAGGGSADCRGVGQDINPDDVFFAAPRRSESNSRNLRRPNL